VICGRTCTPACRRACTRSCPGTPVGREKKRPRVLVRQNRQHHKIFKFYSIYILFYKMKEGRSGAKKAAITTPLQKYLRWLFGGLGRAPSHPLGRRFLRDTHGFCNKYTFCASYSTCERLQARNYAKNLFVFTNLWKLKLLVIKRDFDCASVS
jgi:hypothetical protein